MRRFVVVFLTIAILAALWMSNASTSPAARRTAAPWRHAEERGALPDPDASRVQDSVDGTSAAAQPESASNFTGVVVDPSGAPVRDADVRWWNERTRTDARGCFRLPFGTTVPCEIHAAHPDVGVGETETFWNKPREPVRIVLHAVSRLLGQVVCRAGTPIAKGVLGYRFYRGGSSWSDIVRVTSTGPVASDPFFVRARRRVLVSVRSQSHEPAFREVFVKPGRATDFGTIELDPKPKPARGRILVRVEGDIEPLMLVNWTRVRSGERFEIVTEPGATQLVLYGMDENHRLVVRGVGPRVAVAPGGTIRDYVLAIRKPVPLEGQLVDHEGAPVAGHLVTAKLGGTDRYFYKEHVAARSGARVVTDSRGRFRFAGLIPGSYLVAATDANESPIDRFMDPVRVSVEPELDAITVRLPSPELIDLTVRDSEGGTLEDVRVEHVAANGARRLISGAGLRYRFARPPPGVFRLRISARDRAPAWLAFPTREQERHVRWGIALNRGRHIAGTVRRADGTPAAGVLVRVVRDGWPNVPDWRQRTDARGRFAFPRAPYGRCQLEVEADSARSQTIALADLDDAELEVHLE